MFLNYTDINSKKIVNKKSKKLEEKLNKLHIDKYGQSRWIGNEDWIINYHRNWLQPVSLPPEVVDIVSLCPKFNVKLNVLSKNDIVYTIKNLESKLSVIDIGNNVKNEIRSVITNNTRQNLKNKIALSYTEKLFEHNLKMTKLFIKNNKDNIFFTKADKGNVTVCMKVDAY